MLSKELELAKLQEEIEQLKKEVELYEQTMYRIKNSVDKARQYINALNKQLERLESEVL